jgi:hypothetical protein
MVTVMERKYALAAPFAVQSGPAERNRICAQGFGPVSRNAVVGSATGPGLHLMLSSAARPFAIAASSGKGSGT